MAYLEIGDQSRAVGPGVLTIGSGTEASWRLQYFDLAPLHLILVPEQNGRISAVLGSPEAQVSINGVELDSGWQLLSDGDKLVLGSGLRATFTEIARRYRDSREAFLRDTRRGRVYRIAERGEIGRDLRSTVLIQEPDVSRTHAEIVQEAGTFLVHPRGGLTLVNGQRLTEPTALHEGDELIVGRTHLRFSKEVPRNAVIGPSQATLANTGAGRMRTMFMGTVAMHDHIRRNARIKMGKVAAIVGLVLAVILGLFAVWGAAPSDASARPPGLSGSAARPAGR